MFIIGKLTAGDIAFIRLREVGARAEAMYEGREFSPIDIHYPRLPRIK